MNPDRPFQIQRTGGTRRKTYLAGGHSAFLRYLRDHPILFGRQPSLSYQAGRVLTHPNPASWTANILEEHLQDQLFHARDLEGMAYV